MNTPASRVDADRPVDITIVGGAGHVGLPLAIMFANRGLKTMINDLNADAIEEIRGGKLPWVEYDAQPLLDAALASGLLVFSSKPEELPSTGAVVLTIGTPVDEFHNPVTKVVQQCVDDLLEHMVDGQLLILRSTVYPGTTDWLHRYVQDKGRDIKIAFCPERVVQGYAIAELQGMPQIISGTTPEAIAEADRLFKLFAPSTIEVSCMEAEFSKLFTNAYRYITFAVANQFYMMAEQAGVDFYRVYDAMTRDYERTKGIPKPGFAAGPCLFKDTMQLSAFANNQFSLGQSAMLVNEGLVLHLVDRIRRSYPAEKTTVGLLGMAFKAEVDDVRSSLSYKLKKALRLYVKNVVCTDPFVRTDDSLKPLDQVIEESDVLILCTPHKAYRNLDTKGKPVIDVWNFLPTT